MRRRRLRRRRELPWDEDPRNPDMKVLRTVREEMFWGSGFFEKRTVLMTPEESQQLSRDALRAADQDKQHFPSWDDDPTYF